MSVSLRVVERHRLGLPQHVLTKKSSQRKLVPTSMNNKNKKSYNLVSKRLSSSFQDFHHGIIALQATRDERASDFQFEEDFEKLQNLKEQSTFPVVEDTVKKSKSTAEQHQDPDEERESALLQVLHLMDNHKLDARSLLSAEDKKHIYKKEKRKRKKLKKKLRKSKSGEGEEEEEEAGVALVPLLLTVGTGLLIWFLPHGDISEQGWHLVSIFVATTVGIVVRPLPLGAVALLGLVASVVTNTLTFSQAFNGYSNPTPWLTLAAFLFARGVQTSNIGQRAALALIAQFGHSPLGLSYSLVLGETLLSLAVPSKSARAGGVFAPLIQSIAGEPEPNLPAGSLGSFLSLSQYQSSAASSALVLTGTPYSALSARLAASVLAPANQISWSGWLLASCAPVITATLLTPLLLHIFLPKQEEKTVSPTVSASRSVDILLPMEELGGLSPSSPSVELVPIPVSKSSPPYTLAMTVIPEPSQDDPTQQTKVEAVSRKAAKGSTGAEAVKLAQQKLAKMGPLSKKELFFLGTMGVTILLWAVGESELGMNNATAALLGVALLLLSGVITWDQCLKETQGWDCFLWFAVMISLAAGLEDLGVVTSLSGSISEWVGSLGLAWGPELLILLGVYVYSHYFFASTMAQVSAMYPAFLTVAVTCGAPAYPSALAFCFASHAMASLTHYSSGNSPIYFNLGYTSMRDWWTVGLLTSIMQAFVWVFVGGMWWKFLGILE